MSSEACDQTRKHVGIKYCRFSGISYLPYPYNVPVFMIDVNYVRFSVNIFIENIVYLLCVLKCIEFDFEVVLMCILFSDGGTVKCFLRWV